MKKISCLFVLLATKGIALIYQQPTAQFKPLFEISAVYIEYNHQILLLHRQDHKSEGNKWGIPGGKIDLGETPKEAAIREVKEETNYDISQQTLEDVGKLFIEYDEKIHFTYHMFKVKLHEDPGAVKINFNEHKGFTWVTPSEGLSMDLLKDEEPCIRLVYFPD